MIKIKPEVAKALSLNQAVVALESTIISHGMPYPKNIETALECENIIRSQGAIPATIAIINGDIHIGLDREELDLIANPETEVLKVSRRDIPYVVSLKKHGALTVAATMIACEKAGIKVFATGGIGGVHRDVFETMDISADLEELSNTNVCVVCAGVKSILDIDKTLEYLETKGVPVIGYQTKMMPAFYSKSSEIEVPMTLNQPEEIASFLHAKWNLDLDGGVLVANPIPDEYSVDPKYMNQAIDQALLKAKNLGIKGKKITPFLLSEIVSITGGKSLFSNMQLVYNNALLAAKIAKAYERMI